MTLFNLFQVLKGGPGSGNRGHAGIPGKRGGSAPKGGSASPTVDWGQPKYGQFDVRQGNKRVVIREPNPNQYRDNYETRMWKNGLEWVQSESKGFPKNEAEAKQIGEKFFAKKWDNKFQFVPYTIKLGMIRAGLNTPKETQDWLEKNYTPE